MDIPAIARAGVNTAWKNAASVLSTVAILRDEPTTTQEPVTEVETTTWGKTITTDEAGGPLKALLYSAKEKRQPANGDATVPRIDQMALLRAVDLPGIAKLSTKAELVIGGTVWHILEADAPPGGAIHVVRIAE